MAIRVLTVNVLASTRPLWLKGTPLMELTVKVLTLADVVWIVLVRTLLAIRVLTAKVLASTRPLWLKGTPLMELTVSVLTLADIV